MEETFGWVIDAAGPAYLGRLLPNGQVDRIVGAVVRLPIKGWKWHISRAPGEEAMFSGDGATFDAAYTAACKAWTRVQREAKAA